MHKGFPLYIDNDKIKNHFPYEEEVHY